MSRLAATLIVLTPLTLLTPAWAGNELPDPTGSRIVLHGVDCSIESGSVCDEERPVFDEAIVNVPSGATVVIETRVAEGLGGEPTSALPRASADAVRDYYIDSGIAPERVGIKGCTETLGLTDGTQPVEVQLAKCFQ